MKNEEYRSSVPSDDRTPLPKGETKPCMRYVIDMEIYNATGEIVTIEQPSEYVSPVDTMAAPAFNPHMITKRGARKVNLKRPAKEALEKSLRVGMSAEEIAKKYDCTKLTVYNWIKGYQLAGIQGVRKPKSKEVVVDTPPVEEMVQEFPTLTEVEQFHTDDPVQELPKVEATVVWGPDDTFSISVQESEEIEPSGMTEEENMTDAEWEAKNSIPEPTIGELWEDAEATFANLRRKYAEQADKDFRAQLLQLVLAVTNGRGIA